MTVAVRVFHAHPRRRVRRAPIEEAVRLVFSRERRRKGDISIVFVDGRFSARMNRRFLGHRGATDVISFPLDEKKAVEGEVYVNLDKAREQAGRERVPEHEEILRLVVHGVLHLLGYDDGTVRLRLGMKRREDRCLRALGCGEGMKGLL